MRVSTLKLWKFRVFVGQPHVRVYVYIRYILNPSQQGVPDGNTCIDGQFMELACVGNQAACIDILAHWPNELDCLDHTQWLTSPWVQGPK